MRILWMSSLLPGSGGREGGVWQEQQ